ncbi:glycosyltransferase [Amylibacter sp.]|nr:glycosyltransferase [Amylibacter sp.]
MIFLSIIVTTYGDSEGIRQIQLKYKNASTLLSGRVELIIVNDNPTEIFNPIISEVTLINNKNNVGEASSWQVGVNAAQGKLITLLADDDQISFPDLVKTINQISQDKQHSLYIGNYQLTNSDTVSRLSQKYFKLDLFLSFFHNRGFVSLYCIYEKSFWLQLDGFRDIHGEKIAIFNEYYILYSLVDLKIKNVKFVDYVVSVTVDENSFSASNTDAELVNNAAMKMLKYVNQVRPPNTVGQFIAYWLLEFRIYREILSTMRRAGLSRQPISQISYMRTRLVSVGYLMFLIYRMLKKC